eukprot:4382367-Pleurochrysis_carterae.AAC.1
MSVDDEGLQSILVKSSRRSGSSRRGEDRMAARTPRSRARLRLHRSPTPQKMRSRPWATRSERAKLEQASTQRKHSLHYLLPIHILRNLFAIQMQEQCGRHTTDGC